MDLKLYNDDCLDVLKTLTDNSVDAVVTDPPSSISFMGMEWDDDKGGRDNWIAWLEEIMKEVVRVLKPGGHAFVWALPRTSHWTATALENAGFEIRDIVNHVFGSGFPKSCNISKQLDKHFGAEREIVGIKHHCPSLDVAKKNRVGYLADTANRNNTKCFGYGDEAITIPATDQAKTFDGYGTALKPAHENWILCRKPLEEKTIAENCMKYGTGSLNIDGCRVGIDEITSNNDIKSHQKWKELDGRKHKDVENISPTTHIGRFPANLILSKEIAESDLFPQTKSGAMNHEVGSYEGKSVTKFLRGKSGPSNQHGDSGSASRFFKQIETAEEDIVPFIYCAKPSTKERNIGCVDLEKGNHHPTIKSISLMEYLITLVTPPKEYNPIILDPFMGSGTTGMAAKKLGVNFIGIEKEEEYFEIAQKRIENYNPNSDKKISKKVKREEKELKNIFTMFDELEG